MKISKLTLGLMLISGIYFNTCLGQGNEQMIEELNQLFTKFKPTIKVEYGDLKFTKIDNVKLLSIVGIGDFYPNSKFYIVDVRVEQFGMPIVLQCVVKRDGEVVSIFIDMQNPESVNFITSLASVTIYPDQMEKFSECIFNLLSSALIETRPQDCGDCTYSSSKLLTEKEGDEVKVTEFVNLYSESGKFHTNWTNRSITITFVNQKISTIKE